MIEVNPMARHHRPLYDHAGYLEAFIRPEQLADSINKAVLALKMHDSQYDAIAFSGLSGMLMAPTIALLTNKTMIAVRKPIELDFGNCHSSNLVEGDKGARSYIIVDDFECSGATNLRIKEAIYRWQPTMQYKGMLEVAHLRWADETKTSLMPKYNISYGFLR